MSIKNILIKPYKARNASWKKKRETEVENCIDSIIKDRGADVFLKRWVNFDTDLKLFWQEVLPDLRCMKAVGLPRSHHSSRH